MKRKFIYAVTLLLGLSLFSFYAKAQTWQAYKGVWLKGYDNAAQAPLPPLGYSALTYFADSLGTYVYDWDSLAWLRIPGTGGGGAITTAENGLIVNPAGNVKLGGALTEDTSIAGGGHFLTIGLGDLLFGFQLQTGTAVDNNTGLVLNPSTAALTNVHNGTSGRTSALFLNDNETVLRIDSAGTSLTNDVRFWKDKAAFSIESQRYATIGATDTRFSPTSSFTVDAGSVLMPTITENVNLTDSVMMLDGQGKIWWKTISGGGGGFTTADNGLIANTASNVRIGTSTQPGEVLDEGAVFSTDSLNVGVSHFWFMPDSVQIGNMTDLGEGDEPAYLLIKDSDVKLQADVTSMTVSNGENVSIESSAGSKLTTNVSNPGLVNLSATGSNAALIMQAEKGFQIFDPGLLVAGDGNNAQLQIGRLSGTGDDGVVRIYYTGRTGEIELGVLAGGPFIRGMEDNRTFRVEAVGANSNIVVKAGSGGFVIMEGLPTTDPCGSAPSGTVWDNSGVLNRCP